MIRKEIKGRYKYYIQITIDGIPQLKHLVGTDEVGIDIGTSTIAIVSNNKVILDRLAYGLDNIDREKIFKEYNNFLELHNKEIERIKNSDIKTLKCMGF